MKTMSVISFPRKENGKFLSLHCITYVKSCSHLSGRHILIFLEFSKYHRNTSKFAVPQSIYSVIINCRPTRTILHDVLLCRYKNYVIHIYRTIALLTYRTSHVNVLQETDDKNKRFRCVMEYEGVKYFSNQW